MAYRARFTPKKREEFLAALAAGDSVKHAAEIVGVSRRGIYDARNADAAFASDWESAVSEGTEALEQEAKRRAVDGWDEPVYQGGRMVGVVRKHSDTLLIFLLKGRAPERYKDRHEHTGPDGGAIAIREILIERPSDGAP